MNLIKTAKTNHRKNKWTTKRTLLRLGEITCLRTPLVTSWAWQRSSVYVLIRNSVAFSGTPLSFFVSLRSFTNFQNVWKIATKANGVNAGWRSGNLASGRRTRTGGTAHCLRLLQHQVLAWLKLNFVLETLTEANRSTFRNHTDGSEQHCEKAIRDWSWIEYRHQFKSQANLWRAEISEIFASEEHEFHVFVYGPEICDTLSRVLGKMLTFSTTRDRFHSTL